MTGFLNLCFINVIDLHKVKKKAED